MKMRQEQPIYVKNNQIAALNKTNIFEFSNKYYIRNTKQNPYISIGIAMKWIVLEKYAQRCDIYEYLCKLGICKWGILSYLKPLSVDQCIYPNGLSILYATFWFPFLSEFVASTNSSA
jgi:hypothetical protein